MSIFKSRVDTLLLDEIDRRVGESERGELRRAVKDHASRGSVVLVTHDLAFARDVADDVLLICAGRVITSGRVPEFFDAPDHPLAEQFVHQGNCWPRATQPELPSHFHWIVPGQLAGMGRPGLLREVDEDLTAIATHGIGFLISLTREPFDAGTLRSYGISSRHFPIRDMGIPAIGPAARLCRSMEKVIESGQGVAVHCHAGLGRTGTILAAYLVWTGVDPDEAIIRVRTGIDGAIQTWGQEQFVRTFASSI